MLGLIASIVLASSGASAPDAGQSLLVLLDQAIASERSRQLALGPPKDVSERLVRLGALDQAPRRVVTTFDFSKIPEAERAAIRAAVGQRIAAVDAETQAALLALVPKEGWFLKSRYGEQAAQAAFLIVQHGPEGLVARFLPILEPLVAAGEVPGTDYAMMFDKVAILRDLPQRYGTQFRCDFGKWRPYPVEDPARLDERRAAVGYPGTFATYRTVFEKMPPCAQTPRPPPPGMTFD